MQKNLMVFDKVCRALLVSAVFDMYNKILTLFNNY